MKIEDQVCSLEQAKRLRGLGIDSESLFYHIDNKVPHIGYEGIKPRANLESVKRIGKVKDGGVIRYYAAYTVAELGAMLPPLCHSWRTYEGFYFNSATSFSNSNKKTVSEKTEAQARASILIYLLESKIVHPPQVNHSLNQ